MAVYPTGAIHKPVDNFCYDTGTMSWVVQTCGGGSSGGGGPIQDGVDPTILATVLDLADSNPLTVAIVDANGDQITSFGGSGVSRTQTGTITGFDDFEIDVTGAQSLTIYIETADLDATIQAQLRMEAGGTYTAQSLMETSFNGPAVLATVANVMMTGGGAFRTFQMVLPPGAVQMRFHVTAYTSGTADVILFASSQFHNTVGALVRTDPNILRSGLGIMMANSSGSPRLPIIEAFSTYDRFTPGQVVHIASGDNAAAPVSAKLTDGTNAVTVLPASTAASATDKPLVVAAHPSSVQPISGSVVVSDITNVIEDYGNSTTKAISVQNDASFALAIYPIQPFQISDGAAEIVAVTAASVPAATTDPALVVRTVQLPTALAAGGGLKVEGVLGGVSVPTTIQNVPIVDQGAGSNIASSWFTTITDLVNGPAAVKAASTPAAAADKALVVAISPNNTLSVGTGGTTQYVEDVASAGGESLTLVGAVRTDVPAGSQSADGDYSNLKTDEVGRLWVNARDGKVVDGQFYPAPLLASKLDEMILTNQQIVAALLLLINAVSMKSNVRLKDLSLN